MARDRTDPGAGEGDAGERPDAGDDPGSPEDALRRLGDRLEQASDAAERLISQAADEAAARIGERLKPPPSGWQAPEEGSPRAPGVDLALLLDSLRDLVPADLERRLAEAIRELLLAVRALIDWYVERLDRRRSEPPQVEDIPVR